MIKKITGYEYKGKKVDTLIISRVQRPKRKLPPHCPYGVGPHSVQAWGYRLERGKVEHEDWSKFSHDMLHRCVEDVEIQYLIQQALADEAKGGNWGPCHRLNMELFDLLQKQEEYGWQFDSDLAHKNIKLLNHWIDRIDKVLEHRLPLTYDIEETKVKGEYKHVAKPFNKNGSESRSVSVWRERTGCTHNVGGPFSRVSFRRINLDSNVEAKTFMLAQGWEPDQWNTNGEGEKTSPKLHKDDPFHGVQGSLGRLVARRFQCIARRSILEGLLELVREDGRISGRVSGLAATYRAKHSGIVNIPGAAAFFGRWMRKCFIAKPGWVLVGTDSAGNQARQLAARMGDEEFTQAVLYGDSKNGTDFHSVNARKTGLTRPKAKNFFYAFIFGVGNTKLGRMLGDIGVVGAKAVREKYLSELPGLANLLERSSEEWKASAIKAYNPKFGKMDLRDGWVKALDGRPMQIESEHQILGYFLQSDEAIQMSKALVTCYKWLLEEGYEWGEDFGFVCFMHDEFTIECRADIADNVARLAEKSIAYAGEYYNIPVPHEGQARIGTDWYQIH